MIISPFVKNFQLLKEIPRYTVFINRSIAIPNYRFILDNRLRAVRVLKCLLVLREVAICSKLEQLVTEVGQEFSSASSFSIVSVILLL